MAMGFAIAQLALAVGAAAQQKSAADKQASAQKEQAQLTAIEADAEAKRVEKANKRNEEIQAMQYLKSGVRLEGTPLSVLAETESDNTDFEQSIRESGGARSRLLRTKATSTRRGGRASAYDTVGSAAGNFGKFYSKQPSGTGSGWFGSSRDVSASDPNRKSGDRVVT